MTTGRVMLILLAAAVIICTVPGREIRHLNHILMEWVLRRAYRMIAGRIERNRSSGVITEAVISYYFFLKRCYRHNYLKAHTGKEP